MTNSEKDSSDLDEKPNFVFEGNKYCCLYCGNKYLSRTRCEVHVRFCDDKDDSLAFTEVNGVPKIECKVCSRRFKHLVGMKRHAKKHNLPGGFICSTCGKRFTSESSRGKHQRDEHKNDKQCKIVKLDTSNSITSESDSSPSESFRCDDCGGIFRKQTVYQTHLKTKCGTEKEFVCDMCSAKFLTKNTLYAHKQIHVGVKRHLCDYCGTSFLSKGQLKVHERSHTGEKPFKCEICNKGFSYRESLVTHSSIHTGIKPYACQACDLRFSCIGNLIKHRRARPDTCGLAKYQQNYKIAPRATTKMKHSLDESIIVKQERKTDQSTESPVRSPIAPTPAFENPPTIKKFSETTITDQKPILYRITEITPVDSQIIDLNNVDEIRSLKDENIIVTMEEDQGEADASMDDIDDEASDSQQEEANEEYLPGVPSEEHNGGDEEDYVHSDWYDKPDDIQYVEHGTSTEENYVLEIELQNNEQPNSIYTIIENTDDNECETFIIHTAPQKQTRNNVMIKYEKNDSGSERQEEEIPPEIEASSPPPLYKCTFCPQLYIQQNRLRNHLIVDHAQADREPHNHEAENSNVGKSGGSSKEEYKCPLCPKIYIQPIRLKNHLVIEHSAKDGFACQYCYKWCDSEDERITHQACHGADGSLIHKCNWCKLYFASLDDLETHHSQIHFCFRCSKCSVELDSIDALKTHTDEHHKPRVSGSPKCLKCESCDRLFSTKVALSDHQRSNCGRAPLYKCDICTKSYHSAGSLKTHKTVHSGVLPFQCKYCEKRFRTKGQVKVHERQHNGEKPYKCAWCPKTFGYRESLLTHQSTHTGHKRFMCIPCGTRFSCISNLQSHRKSHKLTCGQHPNVTKPISASVSDNEDIKVQIE